MSDGSYSFSLTTFSPSGKLVQIEYALNAVSAGKTALGIKAKNGVVVATEKKAGSVLLDETSLAKVHNVTRNAGVTYSGMGPDFRVLLKRGRKSAQKYKRMYGTEVPVSQLVREMATVMQEFTQQGGVRPFGVSLLAAGYDEEGPQLYQIDPSGSYWAWKASAIGKRQISAKSFLEKRYDPEWKLEDAIHFAILTLKEGMEGDVNPHNIEIGIVGEDRKFKVLTPEEVKDYLEEVQ